MTTVPPNPIADTTAIPPTTLIVRRGDEQGNPPGVSEETEALRVLTINRFAGSRRIDHCELAYDLGATGERLQDLKTPEEWSRQIEVRVPDPDDPIRSVAAPFWGELAVQNLRLGQVEEASVIASIEAFHFGSPLLGMTLFDPQTDTFGTVDGDITFNPLIDRVIESNRDTRQHDDPEYYLWLDPESVRTDSSRTYQGGSAVAWTLPQAVDAICKICNADEAFIQNPIIDDNEAMWDAAPALLNVSLKRGQYLPEYLDALLHPHGYDWFVDVALDADDDIVAEIVLFQQGVGVEKQIYFQAIGESLDLTKQNVQDLRLDTSIAELANVFRAHGSLQQYEVTLPLYRAWTEAGDNLTANELAKTFDGEPNETFEDNRSAWRLFTANEAGDLIGLRSDSPTAPPDFGLEISTTALPKRRKLERPLTLDQYGKRRRHYLEYSDDAGVTWQAWPSAEWGDFRILEDQIGIYFNDDEPPAELIDRGDDLQLRITGTLTTDESLPAVRNRRDTSPNLRDVELFLDVSDRFHYKQVQTSGAFASSLAGDEAGADEADDLQAMNDWLDALQDVEESASMTARIELFGLHFDYNIGDLITKVAGRNISFNRNSPSATTKKYLQLVGLTWNRQEQSTTLHVVATENR